jgi:hypothetical protein
VLAYDAADACAIVDALEKVGADTVITANATEALQRLDQFRFDAAVIDCSVRFELVAEKLGVLGTPYCVFMGEPPATTGKARAVMRMEDLVPVLEGLLEGHA